MCKFCTGMLTGVGICLLCLVSLVVGFKLYSSGSMGTPAGGGADNAEPVPELADPVPAPAGPVSQGPGSAPQEDSEPVARHNTGAQLLEPVGTAASTPPASPLDSPVSNVTVARHRLYEDGVGAQPPPPPPPPPAADSVSQLMPPPPQAPPLPIDVEVIPPPALGSVPQTAYPIPPAPSAPADPPPLAQLPPPDTLPPPPAPTPPEALPAQPEPAVPSPAPAPESTPVQPAARESLLRFSFRPTLSIRIAPGGMSSAAAAEAPLFTGGHPCVLDDSRRLELPAAVREQMAGTSALMVLPGSNRCLMLCTPADLIAVVEQLTHTAASEEEAAAVRRLSCAQTEKVPLEANGRITIPKALADHAGAKGEMVLIGMGDHLELWEAKRWRQYREGSNPAAGSAPARAWPNDSRIQ